MVSEDNARLFYKWGLLMLKVESEAQKQGGGKPENAVDNTEPKQLQAPFLKAFIALWILAR
jgi:hypothetical protein